MNKAAPTARAIMTRYTLFLIALIATTLTMGGCAQDRDGAALFIEKTFGIKSGMRKIRRR